MKAIKLWQEYKNNSTNLNFLNWVSINYPELNIQRFYSRFLIDWLENGANIFSNKTFIIWLCRNYKSHNLDYYNND